MLFLLSFPFSFLVLLLNSPLFLFFVLSICVLVSSVIFCDLLSLLFLVSLFFGLDLGFFVGFSVPSSARDRGKERTKKEQSKDDPKRKPKKREKSIKTKQTNKRKKSKSKSKKSKKSKNKTCTRWKQIQNLCHMLVSVPHHHAHRTHTHNIRTDPCTWTGVFRCFFND